MCAITEPYGTTVTFSASAPWDIAFAGWQGTACGVSGSECTITLTSDASVPAAFTGYWETTGADAQTWSDYTDAGGQQGPTISAGKTVQISCGLTGLTVDGNSNWYQIESSPWDELYYVSADPFYNNGATSGGIAGTPPVDPAVPEC
jgi:hypothetical protein